MTLLEGLWQSHSNLQHATTTARTLHSAAHYQTTFKENETFFKNTVGTIHALQVVIHNSSEFCLMMMEKLACLSPTAVVALRNSPTILQMMLKDPQCEVFPSVDSSLEKKKFFL